MKTLLWTIFCGLFLWCSPDMARASSDRVLAVSYFDMNTTRADLEPLGRGIADMLITDLMGVGGIELVERARLSEILAELDLQRTAFVDPKTAVKMGKGLGAGWMVAGSLTVSGDNMSANARIINVSTGKIENSVEATGAVDSFFSIEKQLAKKIVASFGIPLNPELRDVLTNPDSAALDTAVAYSRAIDAVDLGDVDAAIKALKEALARDGDFLAAKVMLDEIRSSVAKAEGIYAGALGAKFLAAEEELKACEKGSECEKVAAFVVVLPGKDSDDDQRKMRQIYLRSVLASEIPDDTRPKQGDMVGAFTLEVACTKLQSSCFMASDYACAAQIGKECLERFPESDYAPSMSTLTNTAVDMLELGL